jgi:exosortase A
MNTALWPRLWPAAPALALSALVLQLLFHTEISAAVRVWDSSTAYGHCWLILPIAIFLAYERRGEAASATMAPRAVLSLLAVPFILVWLVSDLLGIMEGRQLALIGFVEVLLLAAFGPRLWWALAGSLLYLVFLVPFGAFVTPALQGFTTGFISHGLDLFGIAHRETGNTIEIPEGAFYVAEACAGLRFLIASIAFGVLYALTMFTSPGRRVAFVAVACVVPILANGMRALGIVVLGHELGSAQAAATDHILYGWLFFAMVITALAVLGIPFRQDAPPPRPPGRIPPPGTGMRAVYAVWPVLLLAAAGPALALVLEGRATPAGQANAVLLTPPSCTATVTHATASPVVQEFVCGNTRLTAHVLLLPGGADPSRTVMAAQAQAHLLLPGADLDVGTLALTGATPSRWVLQRDLRPGRAVATVLFVDGTPSAGGLRARAQLARDMLWGTGRGGRTGLAPAIVAVAVTQAAGDPVRALTDFLAAQGDLAGRVNAIQGK